MRVANHREEGNMASEYRIERTSGATANVDDIVISTDYDPETSVMRRILRTTLVNNEKDSHSPVQALLIHQRRHSKHEPWKDTDSFSLAKLKSGEEAKFNLSAGETRRLYDKLSDLYKIGSEGLPADTEERKVVNSGDVVISGRKKQLIKDLIEQDSGAFFEVVNDLQPNLFEAAAITKMHRNRQAVVDRFSEQLSEAEWSESEWDKFFQENKWIFGYGLAYQFLNQVEGQAYYGGASVSGRGGQRGDYLMSTEAQTRFTVLVEIKKPSSTLVKDTEYRNKVYELGSELTGAVSQVQSNCRTWVTEGSRQEDNRVELEDKDTYTYEPKGILVIGQSSQLDNRHKKSTFELFRRNTHNPEIITYDELLARAQHLVRVEEENQD